VKPDYLWDRSGEPDAEIAQLERLLRTLRSNLPAPQFPARVRPPHPVALRLLATAAALTVMVGGAWILSRGTPAAPDAGWEVSPLAGTPRVGSRAIGENARLRVGQWLQTDNHARARLAIGDIGQIDVEPNTSVRLSKSYGNEHRVAIVRGEIQALIWAPPRQFFVDTPSAMAVDLGCRYTLRVEPGGDEYLEVSFGWVAFERRGRESFIPAGGGCHARPGFGPGTPHMLAASSRLLAALDRFDFGRGGRAALETVLAEARPQDAMTLWHLLARASAADRAVTYKRLAELAPPPAGVTQAGILGLNREMLDLWWNQLGLDDANWWRMWKGPYPGR
jgi:FecR protein